MVFRVVESSYMTYNEVICNTDLGTNLLSFCWIIDIASNIDSIVNNLIWCTSKHPVPSIFSTCKQVSGAL